MFGIYSEKPVDAAKISYYGLYALQHRGQESCGIVVGNSCGFYSHKDIGLVNDVFSDGVIASFPQGNLAVAHVRYGTTGAGIRSNCQPIEVNHQKGYLALAHNGNLSNGDELRSWLELSGAIFHTTSDTETIAYIVTRERLKTSSIEEALCKAMYTLDGAYSLILMSSQKLICARDPRGFRPLCFGRAADGSYIVASESCAITAVSGTFIRDVEPGEILVFSKEGLKSIKEHCGKKEKSLCVFEYIYFSRPDSVVDGISVHDARLKAGEVLAMTHPADADLVIGVPDSGLDAALGYSRYSGIPYGIGLIKNKYIGRTFIDPGDRMDKVKIKLSVVKSEVCGKRIVLVDDSIVRGTTSTQIVELLREAGAKEIHMRISAPPFMYPCYYGTDIDSKENLIACRYTPEETAKIIGADTLGYLPADRLCCLAGGNFYCSACFEGIYPTYIPEETEKNRFEHGVLEV